MNLSRIWHVARFSFPLLILGACAGQLAAQQQVSQLRARHQAGQTLLTFAEIQPLVTTQTIAAERLRELRREAERSGRIRYRVYRSRRPIDSVEGLTCIAELPPLTGWNIDYYGDLRPEHVALRYVVQEGGPPVSPETGIGAFNPAEAGKGETSDILDTVDRWEMTVGLIDRAPQDACTVDITPRRVQQFKPAPGAQVRWTNRSLASEDAATSGTVTVDELGLITLPGMTIGKSQHRIAISRLVH